jgi:hypothetical protein
LYIFMIFKSFFTSFSHLVWGLPNDLIAMGFHSYTFFYYSFVWHSMHMPNPT